MGRIGEKAAKPSSIGESFNQLKRLVKIGEGNTGKYKGSRLLCQTESERECVRVLVRASVRECVWWCVL